MLTEPSAVFFDTGEIASFTVAGGSVPSPEVRGIYEDATTERDSGETSRQASAPHFTCSRAAAANYGEGDSITITGRSTFEILDRAEDDTMVTFALAAP